MSARTSTERVHKFRARAAAGDLYVTTYIPASLCELLIRRGFVTGADSVNARKLGDALMQYAEECARNAVTQIDRAGR